MMMATTVTLVVVVDSIDAKMLVGVKVAIDKVVTIIDFS